MCPLNRRKSMPPIASNCNVFIGASSLFNAVIKDTKIKRKERTLHSHSTWKYLKKNKQIFFSFSSKVLKQLYWIVLLNTSKIKVKEHQLNGLDEELNCTTV